MNPGSRRLTELELREALRDHLRAGLSDDAQIIEELGIERGSARIDLAIVNGALIGYEIKSDFDSLDRLAQQMHAYHRVFDELSIVTTPHFVSQVELLLPPWWGILQAMCDEDGAVCLELLRAPSPNPRQEALSLLSLLWREEAVALLSRHGDARTKTRLNRSMLYEQLAAMADVSTVRDWVSHALRHREDWRTNVPIKLAHPNDEPSAPDDGWPRHAARS